MCSYYVSHTDDMSNFWITFVFLLFFVCIRTTKLMNDVSKAANYRHHRRYLLYNSNNTTHNSLSVYKCLPMLYT